MKLEWFGLLLCVALASCGLATGGSNVSTCLATCSGCCTSQGACMPAESDTACGLPHQLCTDCSRFESTCDFSRHACREITDGGSYGCNPSCGGCCAPTSLGNVCLPLSGQSATACGANAQSCVSCGSGRVCILGACVVVQSTSVGDSCVEDATCNSKTAMTSCRKETADGKYRYVDGYCTRACNQEDCGAQAACVDNLIGESKPLCLARCDSPGTAMGCRAGYFCKALKGKTYGVCWIEIVTPDAGPASERVGAPCASDLACDLSSIPDAGRGSCLLEFKPDGGPTGFVDGYCSADCSNGARCSSDGSATCARMSTLGNDWRCEKGCSAPGKGQGDCRLGYVCHSLIPPTDAGQPSLLGTCRPRCDNVAGATLCEPGKHCDAGYCVN